MLHSEIEGSVIAGLPLSSWLLIAAAVGVGLTMELLFLRAQRGRDREGDRS